MATETTERKIHVNLGSKMNIVNRLVPTSGESAKNIPLIAELVPKNSPLLCGGDIFDTIIWGIIIVRFSPNEIRITTAISSM